MAETRVLRRSCAASAGLSHQDQVSRTLHRLATMSRYSTVNVFTPSGRTLTAECAISDAAGTTAGRHYHHGRSVVGGLPDSRTGSRRNIHRNGHGARTSRDLAAGQESPLGAFALGGCR